MDMWNKTTITEFILVAFVGGPGLQIPLFIIVLLIFIVSLLGNIIMIVIICFNHRLHTPMYFFLWNMSLLELFNILNVVPLMLKLILSLQLSIAVAYCFTQCFFYFFLASVVLLLLPVMAYDRYVAICNPLRYITIMNGRACVQLAISCWFVTFFCILSSTVQIVKLPFCGPNVINHFFCDSFSIMNLACIDTRYLQYIFGVTSFFMLLSSVGVIVVSYILIIYNVLQIPSTIRRQKVFSTCSSHLTMVSVVYGSAIFIEVSPAINPSKEVYITVQMVCTLLAPLLNPFVYTFRNKKVKEVFKDHLLHVRSST